MCGIAGYIGQSKNQYVTYKLITSLFEKTISRGRDAAGFWGTEPGNGKIIYHKQPGLSSDVTEREIWKQVLKLEPDLLLVHCRDTSPGVGHASVNKNNHPFTSLDKSIALMHNGKVPDWEYQTLKKRYEVLSDCDSEILLRMLEAKEDHHDDFGEEGEIAPRLSGIQDIWSVLSQASLAVSIGERIKNNGRRLWMFRNHRRPCYFVDLRETLGQMFFCSTDDIWHEAVAACPESKKYISSRTKMIELPAHEIWLLQHNTEGDFITRYEVEHTGEWEPLEINGDKAEINHRRGNFEVVTELDENEDLVEFRRQNKNDWFDNGGIDVEEVQSLCNEITSSLGDLDALAEYAIDSGRIDQYNYDSLLGRLRLISEETSGLQRMLE